MSLSNAEAAPRQCADTSRIVVHSEDDDQVHSQTSIISFHGRCEAVRRIEVADSYFPSPGEQFLHFQIVEELGRGAFARVYLARQDSLAHRLVVLKLSTLRCGEPQKLAKLQHSNIVPVYSVHGFGTIEVICMPFLGRVTLHAVLSSLNGERRPANGRELLAELIRFRDPTDNSPLPEIFRSLERMTLVEASLWLGSQLAAGLAHAHRRGILHRDLKPANVLLTNDAVPMLLDFNVSSDVSGASTSERIGGTFPYMAPEHLEAFDGAFNPVDERSDLYSLGVILYQILTGRLPHPMTPEVEAELGNHSTMIAQRRRPPIRPSSLNRDVPGRVDAIVLKLLDPAPERRYQRADDLQADLARQLANQSLVHVSNGSIAERFAKWWKRNPRLATGLAVATLALIALILPAATIAAEQAKQTDRAMRLQRAEAINNHAAAVSDLQTAAVLLASRSDSSMREEGISLAQGVLARYSVLEDVEWEAHSRFRLLEPEQQEELKAAIGEVLILMTRADTAGAGRWNQLAAGMYASNPPKVIERQRLEIANSPAFPRPEGSPREIDLYFDGLDLAAAGQYREALLPLKQFCSLRPRHFHAWYTRGITHDALGQFADSIAAFAVCIALRPDFPHAYLNRGLAFLKLRRYPEAEADFTRVLELKENWLPALINRGITRDGMRKPREAEADFTAALADSTCPTRVWFLRARTRRSLGDQAGYATDRAEGLAREPADAHSYRTRGAWRLQAREFGEAMSDFDAALKLYPGDVDSLLNKGIVLADRLNREAEAIPIFDRLLELSPDHVDARCSRGVYHARLGHVAEAKRDAEQSLKVDTSAYRQFQAAGLYAQLSKTEPKFTDEAVRLLARALRAGFNDAALLKGDHDLDPIRKDPRVVKLLSAIGQVDALGRGLSE